MRWEVKANFGGNFCVCYRQIEVYEHLWFRKEGRLLLVYSGDNEDEEGQDEIDHHGADRNVLLTVRLADDFPKKEKAYQCFHPHVIPYENPVSVKYAVKGKYKSYSSK